MLQLLGLSIALLQTVAKATPAASTAPLFIPTYWEFAGYPRISSNISLGTPKQEAIPTIVDLGSSDYWVYQAGAIINYGSDFLFTEGSCNVTADLAYNNTKSHTATKTLNISTDHSYGGNGKIIRAHQQVDDTMRFGNPKMPQLTNQRVALANFTIIREAADNSSACYKNLLTYDYSILGLSAPIDASDVPEGTSFRRDLLANGEIQSGSFSIF